MITDVNLNAVLADLGKIKPTGRPDVDQRMVQYLTSLTKGANPEIPEVMALAQLQAFQKAMSQKPTTAPPQGTVRDKLAQSAGIMALKGAQQQQAPNPAPQGMPIPAGIPQPEMQEQPQAEEEQPVMAAAQGGLMRARVDPRMFEFTHGGIVSFDDGGEVLDRATAERKEREAEIRTYGLNQRRADPEGYQAKQAALAAAIQQEVEARRQYEAEMAKSGAASPAFSRRDVGAAKEALGIASLPAGPGTPQTPDQSMYANRPPVNYGATGNYSNEGRNQMRPPEGAPPVVGPRPPVAPRPPAAPAAPAGPPPSMAQGINALAKDLMPENKYIEQAGAAYKEAEPEKFNAQKKIEERLALQKALGVGRYGEEAGRRISEREKRYEESKKDRDATRLDTMLDAIIRPGYRVGEASQARAKKIEEFKAADKEFAESQDVLKDAKAKYEEALATGNADAILKQRDELDKAQRDYKIKKVDMLNEQAKLQNTATGQALQSATQLTTQKMGDLTQLQIAKLREATARFGYTRPSEAERIGERYYQILKTGGEKAADAFLASESKIRTAVGGVKYEGQDTSTKDSKAVQDAINKRTTMIDTQLQSGNLKPEKEAELLARRERIASQVRKEMGAEGGGGARVVSEADIQATMRSSGKSRDEVVRAAQARGYTIQ